MRDIYVRKQLKELRLDTERWFAEIDKKMNKQKEK